MQCAPSCKNSFYNLEIIPTLENEFTEQQSHMRPPISGKSCENQRKWTQRLKGKCDNWRKFKPR